MVIPSFRSVLTSFVWTHTCVRVSCRHAFATEYLLSYIQKNLVCFYTIIKRYVFNLNVTGIFLNSSSFNSFNYLLFFYFLRVCLSTVYRGVLSHSEEFGRKIYNDFEHEFISRTKLFPSGSVPIGAMTVKHRNNQNNKLKNKNKNIWKISFTFKVMNFNRLWLQSNFGGSYICSIIWQFSNLPECLFSAVTEKHREWRTLEWGYHSWNREFRKWRMIFYQF